MSKEYKDFLLEINTEELPAGYVEEALLYFEKTFRHEFVSSNILLGKGAEEFVQTLATKNSLIVYIKGIAVEQSATDEEVMGPPKRIAFDKNGKPSQSAIAFAKKTGMRVDDLKIKVTPKGDYMVVKKINKARDTRDILKEKVPSIIKNTPFPKTMRWDDSGLRFARPIESILALFGNERLRIELDGIPQKETGTVCPGRYLKQLGELINHERRRERIKSLIFGVEKKLKVDQYVDNRLLDEVNFLVDLPGREPVLR